MSARLVADRETTIQAPAMRPEDFKADDLFAQIQNLVERLAAERRMRETAEGGFERLDIMHLPIQHRGGGLALTRSMVTR